MRYLQDGKKTTKNKVLHSLWDARLAFACNNMTEAKVRAAEAVRYGNRTIMVQEAEEILRMIEEEAAGKSEEVHE